MSRIASRAALDGASVLVALPLSSSCQASECLGMKHQTESVQGVLCRPLLRQPGERLLVLGLILMHEYLQDMLVGHELGHDQAAGCLMGAHLVLICGAGHP